MNTVHAVLVALLAACVCGQPNRASAIGAGDADTMINGLDNAYLTNNPYGGLHYKVTLNDNGQTGEYYWLQAIDIQGEEDAYERTGDTARQTKITNLLNGFIAENHLSQSVLAGGQFNDDLGWTAIALARGYLMTNNGNFLNYAEYAFNGGYNQGWDTQYYGGGIWYDNTKKTPAAGGSKSTLANDSLGIAACLIYQGTGDSTYLTKANNIYNWVWNHIYNSSTGEVYTGIDPGGLNTGDSVYNEGSFVEFANLLHEINGQASYFNDAQRTVNYVRNLYNNGVITDNNSSHNTWADTFARGLGEFVRDNRQWSTYYSWMVTNANSILNNRRTDYNLMDNFWNRPSPIDNGQAPSRYVSAVAWLQYTPATQPNNIAGIHSINSKLNGIAIDNAGTRGLDILVYGNQGNLNQKWNFRQNSDYSWFITSMNSFQQMDNKGSTANGGHIGQYNFNGGTNQRWWVDQQSDGSYKIWSQAAGAANESLDSGSATGSAPLLQWGWSGGNNLQQRWLLN